MVSGEKNLEGTGATMLQALRRLCVSEFGEVVLSTLGAFLGDGWEGVDASEGILFRVVMANVRGEDGNWNLG